MSKLTCCDGSVVKTLRQASLSWRINLGGGHSRSPTMRGQFRDVAGFVGQQSAGGHIGVRLGPIESISYAQRIIRTIAAANQAAHGEPAKSQLALRDSAGTYLDFDPVDVDEHVLGVEMARKHFAEVSFRRPLLRPIKMQQCTFFTREY